MALIFFPEKAENPYFTNLEEGGQWRANFSLKFQFKIDFFHFSSNFKLKLSLPWPPFWHPFSKFEKYGLSAFSGKKINVVACLDQFLAICKMMLKQWIFNFNKMMGFQTKIDSPLAPLFQIRKVWTLSFLWKKIMS